jgi:hypothetical protein
MRMEGKEGRSRRGVGYKTSEGYAVYHSEEHSPVSRSTVFQSSFTTPTRLKYDIGSYFKMSPAHRILLTGANGYIATHILKQLLAAPAQHSIRAVVRSPAKINDVKAVFSGINQTRLDFAVVPDMTVKGAFDEALKSDLVSHQSDIS